MGDDMQSWWEQALATPNDKTGWRSLAELVATPEFRAAAAGEFAPGADLPDGLSRRNFLHLLGASLGLAGVAGCAQQPTEKILPYTVPPAGVTPGLPSYYATSMVLDGFAGGLLVLSHEGRPTKVEGNPEHPANLGATTVHEQASVLQLYDPSRADAARHGAEPAHWSQFRTAFSGTRDDGGAQLRFLLEPSSSPLTAELIQLVRERHPRAKFTFYAPAALGHSLEGAALVFGRPLQPQYDLSRASTVVALDADFLGGGPFALRYARQFADRRRVSRPTDAMNRLYAVEAMHTITGTMADHRLRRRSSEVLRVAAALAAQLLELGRKPPGTPDALAAALSRVGRPTAPEAETERAFVAAAGRDLDRDQARSLVIAGERQPPVVHALAHFINAQLRNTGSSTWTTAPVLIGAGDAEQDLAALAHEMERGEVDTLVVLDGNPVYTAPADLDFAGRMRKVLETVYLGMYENETAAESKWFLPAAHYLESWGDARAYDGTLSLVQPLISPLRGGHTATELLALFAGDSNPNDHRRLRQGWARRAPVLPMDEGLRRGLVPGTAAPRAAAEPRWSALAEQLGKQAPPSAHAGTLELNFYPDSSVHDGRFANVSWLLELPNPATKLTWDNAALFAPRTASRLNLRDQDWVELTVSGRQQRAPVLVLPGHADDAVTLHLGYGRLGAEVLARGAGVNAYLLRTTSAPDFAEASLKKLGGSHRLAQTQLHFTTDGRRMALATTLAAYRRDPDFAKEERTKPLSLMDLTVKPEALEQWAMSIDLSVCTGCSSCVVACQAENNVLVVGKDNVVKSREMHWLRIDTYYSGGPEDPTVVHQPMLCQHCEHAPCEYVCPVNATVHSPDGLNEMVYNRCVGTRFCSNNCPYKVRRFNWFKWEERVPANRGMVALQRNPEVTVRQRGVMEKCSYCVQRIRSTEIRARLEGRRVRDGEIQTACQQACPTRAIVFGSLTQPDSEVVRSRRQLRSYSALNELGTRPRTQYLAKLSNPSGEPK